jgi:hypothetical protein
LPGTPITVAVSTPLGTSASVTGIFVQPVAPALARPTAADLSGAGPRAAGTGLPIGGPTVEFVRPPLQ